MTRPAYVEIDPQAFMHNLMQVRKFAPTSKVMAIAKANAYGHGLPYLAHALGEGDSIGVACLEEAIETRHRGINKPIVLLEGFFSVNELPLISAHHFEAVIHCKEQIEILERSKLDRPINVWIKIDTGMHRLGFLPGNFAEVWKRLCECPHVVQPPRLMSHFACADMLNTPMTQEQLDVFIEITQGLPGSRSLANSASIIGWPDTHADWVRPGIILYGISPFTNNTGLDHNLIPVMTLRSQIIAIHQLNKGEAVGYGATWRCPEDMLIGVVAIGYGDGYPRQAANGTPVLVNGQEVPLVGRVSMDMLSVDLRTQPHTKVGDPVILWGKGLPIERIATAASTVSYELVCGINKRVHALVK